jgi:drug/metabolite transporter (DMT)-like permease
MSSTALFPIFICVVATSAISLLSSRLYRRELAIRSELMAFISFLPGFLISTLALLNSDFSFSPRLVLALFVKNLLYCLSFYYRYESLKKFGPFVGALMLGTQPIVVFFLAFILIGETLIIVQIGSVFLASLSLLLMTSKDQSQSNQIKWNDFAKYYALPALASGLAIVWDRFFLKGELSSDQFFILDRIVILPSFIFIVLLVRKGRLLDSFTSIGQPGILARNWATLATIGVLFTVSTYAYNLALTTEKAALVGLARNSSYPIAAFAGTFIFEQNVTFKKWLSLALVVSAVLVSAFGIN